MSIEQGAGTGKWVRTSVLPQLPNTYFLCDFMGGKNSKAQKSSLNWWNFMETQEAGGSAEVWIPQIIDKNL